MPLFHDLWWCERTPHRQTDWDIVKVNLQVAVRIEIVNK